jgi:hypothetical protein
MSNHPKDKLFPYVVPFSWVDYAGKDSLVSWEFSEDVRMVLVFDGAGTVRNVRPEDLAEMNLDEGQAFELAAENLGKAFQAGEFEFGGATLRDGTEIGCARGSWMAPAGALILGSFHEGLSQQFSRNEFAAVAVNQGCLFAFPADSKTLASESLRLAIDDEFTGHRKPISRSWLLIDGQWPRAWPGEQAF